MQRAMWKRTLLGGLLAVTVASGSLVSFTAGDASANGGRPERNCYEHVTIGDPCYLN